MMKSSKLKQVGGHFVSAHSKTGSAACSKAMSQWKTTGLTPAISAVLGKCRAMAHALKKGVSLRASGQEAKAQVQEHRAATGKVGVKARLDMAKAKIAERRAKHEAKHSVVRPSTAETGTGHGIGKSPREQAAKHRESKGTKEERLKRIDERATEIRKKLSSRIEQGVGKSRFDSNQERHLGKRANRNYERTAEARRDRLRRAASKHRESRGLSPKERREEARRLREGRSTPKSKSARTPVVRPDRGGREERIDRAARKAANLHRDLMEREHEEVRRSGTTHEVYGRGGKQIGEKLVVRETPELDKIGKRVHAAGERRKKLETAAAPFREARDRVNAATMQAYRDRTAPKQNAMVEHRGTMDQLKDAAELIRSHSASARHPGNEPTVSQQEVKKVELKVKSSSHPPGHEGLRSELAIQRSHHAREKVEGRGPLVLPAVPPHKNYEDLGQFSRHVNESAHRVNPGGKVGEKAFISEVHKEYTSNHGDISLQDFKEKVFHAHRGGHLRLARNDMAPFHHDQQMVRDSTILLGHGGAEFHLMHQHKGPAESAPKARTPAESKVGAKMDNSAEKTGKRVDKVISRLDAARSRYEEAHAKRVKMQSESIGGQRLAHESRMREGMSEGELSAYHRKKIAKKYGIQLD